MTVRTRLIGLILLAPMVALGGCIPSYAIREGELDAAWSLTEDPTGEAPLRQPIVGARALPAKWVIRQHESLVWSTVTVLRAFESFDQEPEEISFAISPDHIEALAAILDQMGELFASLEGLAESGQGSDRREWAEGLADILIEAESIARAVSLDDLEDLANAPDEPAGLAAGPILQMLALFINENAGGSLMEDLSPKDVGRIRMILTVLALKTGFDLADKDVPPELLKQVDEMMTSTARFDELRASLADFLAEEVGQAPPASSSGGTRKAVELTAEWGPRAMDFLTGLIRQWDKMDRVELSFHDVDDRPQLAATVHVRPGEEVRFVQTIFFQPTFVFRGSTRIVLLPMTPETHHTAIVFEPIDGGAAEIRFEGFVYSMARTFAMPLANSVLREMRVFTGTGPGGVRIVNAAVLMEALDGDGDPRRMLVYHDVRRDTKRRTAFAIETIRQHKMQTFSYLTPSRRYTYQRVKVLEGEDLR
ncbi:MAG: hypothetical protein ACYTFO_04800 [Planctomycetota bacterium]